MCPTLQTIQHALPMLSLAARNSKEEVQHWHDVSFSNNLQKLSSKSVTLCSECNCGEGLACPLLPPCGIDA